MLEIGSLYDINCHKRLIVGFLDRGDIRTYSYYYVPLDDDFEKLKERCIELKSARLYVDIPQKYKKIGKLISEEELERWYLKSLLVNTNLQSIQKDESKIIKDVKARYKEAEEELSNDFKYYRDKVTEYQYGCKYINTHTNELNTYLGKDSKGKYCFVKVKLDKSYGYITILDIIENEEEYKSRIIRYKKKPKFIYYPPLSSHGYLDNQKDYIREILG